MTTPKSVLIFAEPKTIVSDGLVPHAVEEISRIDGLSLEGIVDVKEDSDPSRFTGITNYFRYLISDISDFKQFVWRVYRRSRGFRNPTYAPYPSTLSMKGYDESIHCLPPEDDVQHPDFISEIGEKQPDVILLLGCSKIINEQIIDIPTHGVVNYHWSYLPDYRGRRVTFWAAYNQEEYSGVTFHKIDPEIDQGVRINAERVRIEKGGRTLAHDCIKTGRRLLTPLLEAISDGCIPENGKIKGGEYYSLERFEESNTEFDPSEGFNHNSRVVAAREGCLVEVSNGRNIMVTGLKSGENQTAPGECGEILGVGLKGIKVNLGGGVHYVNKIFYLPAYPLAKLLGIKEGMRIQ